MAYSQSEPVCSNCESEDSPVAILCNDCAAYFCSSCDRDLHLPVKMRHHARVDYFPSVITSSRNPTDSDVKVYCICRQPDDGVRPMIDCNACDEWFHLECLHMTSEQAELLYTYKCASCQANAAVEELVEALTGQRLLLKSGHMENPSTVPVWGVLPPDVIFDIFEFMGAPALASSFAVCRAWRDHNDNALVWKALCERKWRNVESAARKAGIVPKSFANVDWKALYQRLDKDPSAQLLSLHEAEKLRRSNQLLRSQLEQVTRVTQKLEQAHSNAHDG